MSASWTKNIDWQHVHETLVALPKGERGAYLDQVAAMAGKSRSTIYKEHQRRFGKSKEVHRENTVVTEEDLRRVARVLETYRGLMLKGQPRRLSLQDAIDILKEEQYERAHLLVASTVAAALRRRGYGQAQRRVRVEAAYACQQYQIDFSRSKHFQIIDDLGDGDWLCRVSAKELHYKDGSARLRTWVAQVIDEHSRLRIIRYYAATGEDRYMGLAALHFLLNRQEDDHLMRHVPERLKSDQGAFLKSQEGRSACQALGITVKLTEPGNKESQGKVERGFRTTWQTFEAKLATTLVRQQGPKATIRLSRLCALAHAYTTKEHERPHPVFRDQKRGAMYQRSILRHRPRELSHDIRALALRTWDRKADQSAMIYVENTPLQVPDFAIGKWVRVYRTVEGDYAGTLVDGFRKEPFPIQPYRFSGIDDFSQTPHRTFAQEMAREAAEKQRSLVTKLRPATEKVQPQSPVLEAQRAAAEPERLTKLQALAEVGRALDLQGVAIGEIDLSGLLYDGMTRDRLNQIVAAILTTASRKAM